MLTTYDGPSTFENQNLDTGRMSALGRVTILNLESLDVPGTISTHDSSLSCMSINQDGRLLATMSERGTIVWVWSLPKGQQLYQFRRGSRKAEITSMSFNLYSSILAVSSARVTIHLFKLDSQHTLQVSQSSSTDTLRSSVSLS